MKKIMCICLVAIMLFIGLKNKNSFTGMEKSIKDTTQKNKKIIEKNSDNNIEAALQLYNGEKYFDDDKIEKKLKEEKELKNHIVWCVPTVSADTDVISREKIKKINGYLSHKYKCYMDILYVTDDAEGSYNKGILGYLDKQYVDVFFSGFTYDEDDYNAYENLIENNYAYDMSYDLKQQKNASLYNAFNENEWVGIEKDGHVFAIPNQNFLPHRCYAAFKKDKFTKSEIKNLPDNKDIVDLTSILEKIVDRFGRKNFDAEINFMGEVYIVGDEEWLFEAISNLVDNSIVHGNSQKPIQIRVREFDTDVRVSITDFGSGISNEEISKVFDRYYTGSDSDSYSTGIGMNLARYVIEAHYSDIRLSSSDKTGLKIEFNLPKPELKQKIRTV